MNKKRAFSVIELIMTCIIMVMVCIATPLIIVKKNVKKPTVQKEHASCDCYSGAKSSDDCKVTTVDGHTVCKFTADNTAAEFFSIDIIGGGAGGCMGQGDCPDKTSASGEDTQYYSSGGAGESKIVYYPAMRGIYCIRIGLGGQSGTSPANGEDTVILRYDLDSNTDCSTINYENAVKTNLLDYALGGIVTHELTTEQPTSPEYSNLDSRFGQGGVFETSEDEGTERYCVKEDESICDSGSSTKTAYNSGCPSGYKICPDKQNASAGAVKIRW